MVIAKYVVLYLDLLRIADHAMHVLPLANMYENET